MITNQEGLETAEAGQRQEISDTHRDPTFAPRLPSGSAYYVSVVGPYTFPDATPTLHRTVSIYNFIYELMISIADKNRIKNKNLVYITAPVLRHTQSFLALPLK
jgi:hypothetical protein